MPFLKNVEVLCINTFSNSALLLDFNSAAFPGNCTEVNTYFVPADVGDFG
jgi:hypothetical protein